MRINILEQKMWKKVALWLYKGSWKQEVEKLIKIIKMGSLGVSKDVIINLGAFFLFEEVSFINKKSDLYDTL